MVTKKSSTFSLSELKPGEIATVVELIPDSLHLVDRLMEMGIIKGSQIEITHQAPFGGAVSVRCRGTNIALRKTEASRIMVRVGA